MSDETPEQAAAQEALDAACLEYLRVNADWVGDTPLMLEGFVIMVQGRELSVDGVNRSTNIWGTPNRQPVALTLGLASMLEKNVDMWFRSGETREDE